MLSADLFLGYVVTNHHLSVYYWHQCDSVRFVIATLSRVGLIGMSACHIQEVVV
jgi:hypothetical protein